MRAQRGLLRQHELLQRRLHRPERLHEQRRLLHRLVAVLRHSQLQRFRLLGWLLLLTGNGLQQLFAVLRNIDLRQQRLLPVTSF